ncbi:MAG: hypothetical protein JNJ83_19030 [Verrucomicrobiaceae bacterium]|nr:hypothetical protein [Verrucomicrobiaceae bacterium]
MSQRSQFALIWFLALLGNVQEEGRSVPEYAVLGIQRYLYDKTGNLRWMSERYNGQSAARTVTLAYDASLRLDTETIAEADGGTQLSDYNYDALGNRTTYTKTVNGGTPTVSTYTHNAWNQLEQFTRTGSDPATVSYEYDDGGNRKKRTKGTQVDNYTWDHLGRLKSVAHAGTNKTYAYEYDYRSRRVSRLEGGDLTLCGYSGGTSVVELKRAANNSTNTLPGSVGEPYKLSKTFIRGSDMGGGVGGLIYSLKQTASGPSQPQVTLSTGTAGAVTGTWSNLSNSHVVAPRYNHYNGRGDVAAQVDDAGTLAWTGSYEAYGTRTKETGSNDDRQRANTKEEDPTGLLNEGMRYRDLETGTWLSRDPAGFVDGPNLYAYVRCNPWSKFDPLGLCGWADPRSLPNCSPAMRQALEAQDRQTAARMANDIQAVGQWMGEHPRTMGTVQAVGGAAQTVAGAVGLAAPTGVTQVAGGIAVAHGIDDMQAGIRQAWTGKPVDNLTTQATEATAKALGASDGTARTIAVGTNIAAGFVAPVTSAKGVVEAADEMASGVYGFKGVVQDGQIVGKPKLITDTARHEDIASKAGVLKEAPTSGTPGTLADGAEAFTAQANGKGGWNVGGSGNFNRTVSPSGQAAVQAGLGTSPTISGSSASTTAAQAGAAGSAASAVDDVDSSSDEEDPK